MEGGLRDVERYLDGEIEAIAVNVVERFRDQRFCEAECWEGMVIREEERKERERKAREGLEGERRLREGGEMGLGE